MVALVNESSNPNVNCLTGRCCPVCGSFGPFEVSALMRIILADGGVNMADDPLTEYDEGSRATCCLCKHQGVFGDFAG